MVIAGVLIMNSELLQMAFLPDHRRQLNLNGSILLFHARPVDVRCIRTLIPQLKEKGFEFVTIAELIGLDKEVATSTDLFVFNMADYY